MNARPAIALAAAIAALAPPTAARADATDACIQASDEGQVLRDQGKLLAARARFVACSRDACPRIVRADCTTWLADAGARIPTVVLSARDAGGHDTADVKVSLDGTPIADRLEARAIPVDPGSHRFRFEISGAAPVEETVILREGELRRAVSVRFGDPGTAPAPSPVPTRPTHGVIAGAVTLGALALVGGGVFAGLASSAQSDANHLRATCAPACVPRDVDSVRTRLIGANVALGAGIAALSAGVGVLVWGPREMASVAVAPGGAVVRLGGRF